MMREYVGRRRIGLVLMGIALLAGCLWFANRTPPDVASSANTGPVPVVVAKARIADVPVWLTGVGSIQPIETVDVKSRVDGQIVRILFREGDQVAQGQVLVELDPRPFQAALDQACAVERRDAAQLADTRLNLDRARKLAALGAGTSQNVDTLGAQAAAQAATIAADRAQIETARLNLDWSRIRAPIAGRVGLREVNLGAAVHAADPTGVVTVTQIAPIAAVFSLPQDKLPEIVGAGPTDPVIVADQGGTRDLAHGQLASIDNVIDGGSGQFRVKAWFANRDHRLWPGALITARVLARVVHHVVTVPKSALQTSQNGSFVYVVNKENVVAARPVATGPIENDVAAIMRGLRENEIVVVSGQSRIAVGTAIAPQPFGS